MQYTSICFYLRSRFDYYHELYQIDIAFIAPGDTRVYKFHGHVNRKAPGYVETITWVIPYSYILGLHGELKRCKNIALDNNKFVIFFVRDYKNPLHLDVVDRYLRRMGDIMIPDEALQSLESFYPPWVDLYRFTTIKVLWISCLVHQ